MFNKRPRLFLDACATHLSKGTYLDIGCFRQLRSLRDTRDQMVFLGVNTCTRAAMGRACLIQVCN